MTWIDFPYSEIVVAIVTAITAVMSLVEWQKAKVAYHAALVDSNIERSTVDAYWWRAEREWGRGLKQFVIFVSTVIVLFWRVDHIEEHVPLTIYVTRNVTLLIISLLLVHDMLLDRRTRDRVVANYRIERRKHPRPGHHVPPISDPYDRQPRRDRSRS